MSSTHDASSMPSYASQLIQSGYISLPKMQQALIETKKTGRALPEILQALTGRPLPEEFLRQYKKEHLLNLKLLYEMEVFDPDTYSFDWNQVEELIDTLIPLGICRRYRLFPLKRRNNQPPSIVVAMVNPKDAQALEALKQILRPKQMKLARKVITEEDYHNLIEQYIIRQNAHEATQVQVAEQDLETLVGITDLFEDAHLEVNEPENTTEEHLGFVNQAQEGPVPILVNNILADAIESKASEVHLEPQDTGLEVSFRQDGIMQPPREPVPREIASAVVSQIKMMASLDISQRNIPQKGRARRAFWGRKIDIWVSTLPGRYGEKIVLRILDPQAISLDIKEIITEENTRTLIENMVSRSTGLLLITGRESSGLTTTFYTLLCGRNQLGTKIATVESPIERPLAGINQIEIDEQQGHDYDSTLQSLLDKDVDIIGVDQIRGRNTAKTVVDAALSQLVLTTLPTPDAASAIVRLNKMGVEPDALADNLIGVINQRLVRRVCPVCRLSYSPGPAQLSKLGLSPLKNKNLSYYKANTLTPEEIEQAKAKGRLCRHCNGLGYKGQIGVFEVMTISQSLKALITQDVDAETIKKQAVQDGMKPLLNYALDLALQGETTLEEIQRVLPDILESMSVHSSEKKGVISPQMFRRLQEMEKLLEALTREFQELKHEFQSAGQEDTEESTHANIYEELRDNEADWETLKKELEPDKATMISGFSEYEELSDPGEWEALKKELEPDKETMISGVPFDDDDFESSLDNPFKSISDPW